VHDITEEHVSQFETADDTTFRKHTYKMNTKGANSWPLKDTDKDERFSWFIDLFFCKWGLLGCLNS
jgi:hypothetical protein